jgi:DNA-binding transcriptional regulator LsrR (DeoR family)
MKIKAARNDKAARNERIIKWYKRGWTIRKIADKMDISFQRVHQLIQKEAPDILRPTGRQYS